MVKFTLFICFSIEFQVKKEGWGGGGTRVVKFTLFICCSIEFQVKKEGWGGGGTRVVKFTLFICCSIEFQVKKEGWGGGGTRVVKFTLGSGEIRQTKVSGKQMVVSIGQGLPENSSQSLIH